MNASEIIIAFIYSIIILVIGFILKSSMSTDRTAKYFMPALLVKIIGGLAVGMIYYLYYGGGDTVNYYDYGAVPIFDAFLDSPATAFQMIFGDNVYTTENRAFSTRIFFFRDSSSYNCIRYAGFFNLFSFNTYSGTVILFAFFSFICVWKLFQLVANLYPHLTKEMAISFLFLPSVFFWGSGILKDTITFALLCLLIFNAFRIYFLKEKIIFSSIVIVICTYAIMSIKVYIVIAIVPAIGFLFLYGPIKEIQNKTIRMLITPFALGLAIVSGFVGMKAIGETSDRYNIETLAYTASETAKWIEFVSKQQGGAVYSLGGDTGDFSALGVLKKTIPAIWVTLFRPHPWEIKNPVMLLSGIEALFFLVLFVKVFGLNFRKSRIAMKNNIIIPFSLIFALTFSWAVGITSYNFGTLVRYKIPMMPFFIMSMYIARSYIYSLKKQG